MLSNKPDWVRFPSAQIRLLVRFVLVCLRRKGIYECTFGTWLQRVKSALPDFYVSNRTRFFDSVLTPAPRSQMETSDRGDLVP